MRIAIITAELCSAALPMIGTTISPTNTSDSPMCRIASSVEPTRISDSQPTVPADSRRTMTERVSDHRAPCSCACDSAATSRDSPNTERCVPIEYTSEST